MKIDDLITQLDDIKKRYGNIDVLRWNDEWGRVVTIDDDPFFLSVTTPEKKITRKEAKERGVKPVYPDWPLAESIDPTTLTSKIVVL